MSVVPDMEFTTNSSSRYIISNSKVTRVSDHPVNTYGNFSPADIEEVYEGTLQFLAVTVGERATLVFNPTGYRLTTSPVTMKVSK